MPDLSYQAIGISIMMVLGLQGSPRRKSNTAFLLSTFMDEARKRGARTVSVEVCRKNIVPCKELVVCEKKGYCPIDDDMKTEIYPLLRQADIVVAATPIFFYNATAQLKAVIDRSQTLWARKYRLKVEDPGSRSRRGFLLAVAATRGKNLFEGLFLTAKYFFDAIASTYEGDLVYKQIEHPGDLKKHPTVRQDVEKAVDRIFQPFSRRRTILFASKANQCRSIMAWAAAKYRASDKFDVIYGGTHPADNVHPSALQGLKEKGLDVAFVNPRGIGDALDEAQPDIIVTMEKDLDLPGIDQADRQYWDIPSYQDEGIDHLRDIRDRIDQHVDALITR